MTEQWSVPAWAALMTLGVLLVVVLAAVVVAVAVVRPARRSLEEARAGAETLQQRLDQVEQRLTEREPGRRVREDQEYVITHLGDPEDAEAAEGQTPAPVVPAPLFADIVLRETVVQATTLAAGLRRALAPETRHRIRFEMRRELKRARKQRRADLRTARREWEARQRAAESAA